MATRRMVALITMSGNPGAKVPEHRVEEVLIALHYLERAGYGGAVHDLYLLCANRLQATDFHAKLVEEGLAEQDNLSAKTVKIDPTTRAIVLAAVTYYGPHRITVARGPKDIIQR